MSRPCMTLVVVSSVISFSSSVQGQVTLPTSGSYSQSFDNLGSGLPTGWSVQINATSTSLGQDVSSAGGYTKFPTPWSTNSGQFANFASALNPGVTGTESTSTQNGYTNRALGVRQTSSTSGFGDPGAALTLQLTNTTGYKDFTLSFSAQLLNNTGRDAFFTVRYGMGSSPSSFTSLGTFDTNSLGNGTFGSTPFSASFNGIDNLSDPIWIQIADLTPSSGSGTLLDTFAIDNVQLTYTPVPEPATIGLVAAAGLGASALLRRLRHTRSKAV